VVLPLTDIGRFESCRANMKVRIISGVLGAAGFLFLLWLGSWWYSALIWILATICFIEYCRLFEFTHKQPQVILGIGIVWLMIVAQLKSQFGLSAVESLTTLNVLLLGLVLFLSLLVFSRNQFDIYQMAHLFIGTVYIGLGFSFMIKWVWQPNGFLMSLFVLLVIWGNDTGAYFVGKKFGKRKFFPAISPNKTIAGSVGGILFGLVISLFFAFVYPQLWTVAIALLFGLLISVLGQLGDLVESAIKRSTGTKDSGKIIPGHGGVLDRFDSLIFTFLVLQLFMTSI
jgi:phosphatidate cytidylyltransferase